VLRRYRIAYENLNAVVPKDASNVTVELQSTKRPITDIEEESARPLPGQDLEETLLSATAHDHLVSNTPTTDAPEVVIIDTAPWYEKLVDKVSIR
jgi:hypothetical protein